MAKGEFKFEYNKSQMAALEAITRGFGTIDGNKAILNSLSKGIQRVTQEGRKNLISSGNKKTGNLLKSIRKKQVKKWMSVYGGFRKGKGGGNNAHLIDRGTKKRKTSAGYNRGSVFKKGPYTGTRFWTNAVLRRGPEIMNTAISVIYNEIAKIIRKKK